MHLREVQMENFKSFGRKLTVPFEPGFTGITGPNGSGKSNIGDAVLFVLGPNSPRAIRAGRLSDLIFNGGEGGKGADHCAVSLVFDNADRTMPVDADTVTLTRKVRLNPSKADPDGYYSYFYVNGRASQKKEFVDLLQHAGISADGYNITQQGDVQRICTVSPVDRRRILDDIAGVTTFDKDIAVADARKADVLANLERIKIVLDEIGRALTQLEKEKGAAQRYRELQDQVRRLKGLMAWRRKADLEAQVAQVHQQIAQFTADRAKLEEQHRKIQDQHKEVQARFAEAEREIKEQGGEEAQKIQAQIEAARDAMVRMEEKINFAKAELASAAEDGLPLTEELRKIEKELERTRKAHGDVSKEAEAVGKGLTLRKKELEDLRNLIAKSDSGALQVNRELSELKQEHEAGQLRLHETRLEADRAQERLRALDRAIADLMVQEDAAEKDLDEAAFQLKDLKEGSQGVGKKRKEAEGELFNLRKKQADLARDSEELENRIRRLQREIAELRAAQEASERAQGGFGRAVEEVLKARDAGKIKGIIGTVAELAKVDDRHKTAMQVAAGNRLTSVIVEDDGVAAQCIEMLKRSQAGRVTFLPLTKMVPGRPRAQALMKSKAEGVLGFAIDLIQFNARYQNAFFFVFGDTLVVDTMANARRIMGGIRMATQDGELFEASGAMTGGGAGKKGKEEEPAFGSGDRGRMDELLHELAAAEAAQEETVQRLGKMRAEVDELTARLAAEGHHAAGAEDRVNEIARKSEALKERLKTLREELGERRKEQGTVQKEEAASLKGVEETTARLAELERLRQEKAQLLLKGTKKDIRDKVEALDKEVRDLTEALLKAENRRDVAAKQMEIVEARRKEVAAAATDRTAVQARSEDELKRFTQGYGKAKAEVEALMKMERKATGNLKGLQERRDKAYQALVDLKSKMDGVATRMETHFGLITNAKSKLPVLEEALGEAMVELKESPVEVGSGTEVPTYDELKRDLKNQEAALERLGAVNMRALEEYEAQSERERTLKDETARLEAQRAELERLVAEIALKKKASLMEVFTAISQNFTEVYAKVSYGGHALMELENEADPFQGGLILKAQPMGKKVTRLEALSGGEKSLTSMAFIFAIQRYSPSPFYYFDEVDQNLDAVNSELLAKMIRDNAQFAQFIVVSLRKITLKEANHLYGVTQSSPGQSEIIANFDIDTLRDEKGDGKPEGGGSGGPADGFDGEAPAPAPPPKPKKKTKETTIGDVLSGLVTVEVKQ